MAVGTALKLGSQVIKHAPKVQKLKKLGTLQKVLRNVKSTSKVIQSKLKTKQNLAKISETIGDVRNKATQNKAVINLHSGGQKLSKYTVGKSHDILKNRASYLKAKSLNKVLHGYMGGMGPKDMIRNLAKAKGLGGKLSAGARFIGPAFEILELYDKTGQMLQKEYKEPIEGGPDNSIRNNLVNMATNLKHIGDRDKYKRTKLSGAADLKISKWFTGNKWNPFDDEQVLVPNMAKRHNLRADRLAKWDARRKRIEEAK